jgi:hypothetical protein
MIQNLNSNGQATIIIAVISGALSVLAVGLRMYSRRYFNSKYDWDDWWILFTLLSFSAFIAVTTWGEYEADTGVIYLLTSCEAFITEGERKTLLVSFGLMKKLPASTIVCLPHISK